MENLNLFFFLGRKANKIKKKNIIKWKKAHFEKKSAVSNVNVAAN